MSVLCQASYGAQIAFTDASGAITSLIGKPGVALERAQFTDATGDFAGAGRSILSSERGLFDAVRLLND